MLDDVCAPPPSSPQPLTGQRYRSGYSFKDAKQAHILALTMSRDRFEHLLSLSSSSDETGVAKDACAVRVQWDPERNVELARMPWRSVQIGIGRAVVTKWVEEWILKIEVGYC